MVVPRFVRLAFVAGLLASLAFSGLVAAADRSTSVLGVWGTMGVWGTHANFFARWQVTTSREGGVTLWTIDDFDMDAILINGDDCTSLTCEDWSFATKVEFLNSAGAVVATTTLPVDSCYATAVAQRDRPFSRCRRTSFGLTYTAKKVRLTWTVSVKRASDGFWLQAWRTTKTVSLS